MPLLVPVLPPASGASWSPRSRARRGWS